MINEYQLDNKGPYTVWIQPIASNETSKNSNHTKRISPFKVGSFIRKKYTDITYICSKTKSRVEIEFKNSLEANQMLKDVSLSEKGLKAFIPSFRLVRRSLIRGIDEDISEEEITEATKAEYKVLGVRRLNKRNRDPDIQENDPKWYPADR